MLLPPRLVPLIVSLLALGGPILAQPNSPELLNSSDHLRQYLEAVEIGDLEEALGHWRPVDVVAAARLGMEVLVARPPAYDLDADDMASIEAVAGRNGGSVTVTDDLDAAVAGADAVYAKSWGSLEAFGMARDHDTITCLRSVLMKPEHLDWIDRIWALLDEATETVCAEDQNARD